MHNQLEQQSLASAVSGEYLQLQQPLYKVAQFVKAEPAFTESGIRNYIFKAQPRQSTKGVIPGNGLLECGAIIRVGRKVLIDRDKFLFWVRRQNGSTR